MRVLRVNARAAEEEQFLHAKLRRRFDDVVLDLEIPQQELHGKIVVRLDTADFRRSDRHDLRPLFFKERTHRVSLAQIQLGARARDDVGVACALEFAVDGAAGEAAMAGDVNAVGLLHGRG